MNAIGVQVESARARPIMSFFHAMWSVGNFIGAAMVLLMATVLGMTGGSIVSPLLITPRRSRSWCLVVLIKITPGPRSSSTRWTACAPPFPGPRGSSGSWPSGSDCRKARPPTGPRSMSPTSRRSTRPRARSAWSRSAASWFSSGCSATGWWLASAAGRWCASAGPAPPPATHRHAGQQLAGTAGGLGAGRLRCRDDRPAGVRGRWPPRRRPGAGGGRHFRLRGVPDGACGDRVPGTASASIRRWPCPLCSAWRSSRWPPRCRGRTPI